MLHDHKSKNGDNQGASNLQSNITNYPHFELFYLNRL